MRITKEEWSKSFEAKALLGGSLGHPQLSWAWTYEDDGPTTSRVANAGKPTDHLFLANHTARSTVRNGYHYTDIVTPSLCEKRQFIVEVGATGKVERQNFTMTKKLLTANPCHLCISKWWDWMEMERRHG